EPEKVDMIVFRENLEDVYAGVEWKHGSPEAAEVIRLINAREGQYVAEDSAIGIKPMSARNSKNLVRRAIRYAIDNGRASVTLVHKGNIMKYTEGAFREWGYELARDEFPDTVITERECWDRYEGKRPGNLVVLNDRIADDMFQQALLNPARYDVIATTNLNGDYLSDALAAQVGGVGIAPGANMGDGAAIFESIHGTAPRYAGKDIANPSALILSGGMMLRFLGWREAADALWKGLGAVIARKTVTRDLARRVEGATALGCAAFGEAVEKAVLSAGQGAP
ncbi:MAG: NADP-dependent isocitrate dehydrogenase, partial [Spirochaetes bacterium]